MISGARWLAGLPAAAADAVLAGFGEDELAMLMHEWRWWARPEQLAPPGDWPVWLVLAGRGFGKTRAGAEWVRDIALGRADAVPAGSTGRRAPPRIALVGATFAEARAVMVEGPSGILALGPATERPRYEPSLRRLTWEATGAVATLYSAADAESLRGAQHSHGWCDELGKWPVDGGEGAFDNLMLGLRLGSRPRLVVTTTPRTTPLMRRVARMPGVIVTGGPTSANAANLATGFGERMAAMLGDTPLARQELAGELIEEIEGALWTRPMLAAARGTVPPAEVRVRVVVGVDPSVHEGGEARAGRRRPGATSGAGAGGGGGGGGDACGIIVAARCTAGLDHVLEDASVPAASPERWAQVVADVARRWRADLVVAEANNGGALVASVLRAADAALPVRLVHAARGKAARAEPVALRYATGQVRHAGDFPALEAELCGLMAGGDYVGPGRSPDRADALVWAVTALMEAGRTPGARVRVLG